MPESRYASAVQAFRDEGRTSLTRSAFEGAGPEPDPAELLARSQEIEDAAAAALNAGDGDVRELGAIQLAAGAALDLAAAVDLLEPPTRGALEADAVSSSRVESVYSELEPVLAAPTVLGARAAAPQPAASALEDAMDGLAGLGATARKAIDAISADAAKIAGNAVDGLLALPADALLGAFAEAADKLLGPVYQQVKGAVRWAVQHIAKAISKLLRLLGPLEGPARKWLEESLGGKTKDRLTAWAVDGALGTAALRADVAALITDAAQQGDESRLRAARDEIASLAPRFSHHELVVRVLAKVLGKLQTILLALASWVAAALAGVYVLMLTYGVWVAGDFLDWKRTREEGRLDFVAGVLGNVRLAVAAP